MNSQGTWRLDNPIVWTPELVKHLEVSKNNIAWAIDHCIDCILGGFITELTTDTSISYSKEEHIIFKGPQGKYLKYSKTWIEILLCEKQFIPLT